MRRVLMATSMILVVAGCSRYWARPGGTTAEWESTRAACEQQAISRFPLFPINRAPGGIYLANPTTFCAFGPAGPSCATYGGTEVDLNGQPRGEAFRACAIAAGWLPAKDQRDADAITRSRGVAPPSPSAIDNARQWCDTMFRERRNATVMAVYNQSVGQCIATRAREPD
jgi:hypothetical protein